MAKPMSIAKVLMTFIPIVVTLAKLEKIVLTAIVAQKKISPYSAKCVMGSSRMASMYCA